MMLFLALAFASAPAPSQAAQALGPRQVSGPDRQVLDLLRPGTDFPRIYVQTTLPDGETALFLIDTGADISVISEETAKRLELPIDRSWGMLSGLSGQTPMHRAVLPSLGFGDVTVHQVEVAVGVPGVSDQVGFMPVDGLLGNNVWGRFTLELDYPADTMVLHTPGTIDLPRKRGPMHFDGRHVFVPVEVRTSAVPPTIDTIIAQLDTGASGLTICAATGQAFAADTTEGIETLRGIGASERLPPYRFLETTRRIDLDALSYGGNTVQPEGASARWVNFNDLRTPVCDAGMRALMGHEFMADHRILFDYAAGEIAVTKSKRKPRHVNGHETLYNADLAEFGSEDSTRGLVRGKLLLGMDDEVRGVALLKAFASDTGSPPEQAAEARTLLAQIARQNGELALSRTYLHGLEPADLVDQDQIIATVNGLIFDDQPDEALSIAQAAVVARPDVGDAHVALADVLLALRRPEEARSALLKAAELEQYPDAHLLRRARVALATGDRHGSMAHVRKLLQLYPFGGHLLWFYANLLETEGDKSTFRSDMDAAMARLHPRSRPFDFLVAAHHVLGDDAEAEALRRQGLEEHCAPMQAGPAADNCRAWYDALAGQDLDHALERVDRALASEGERSDFLDTKAMVHLARHEVDAARQAAIQAARMSPDDVYMLWQAERISDIAATSSPTSTAATPPAAQERP